MSTQTSRKELHIQEYLKLLPEEFREEAHKIFVQIEEDQFEDIFQEILQMMHDAMYSYHSEDSFDTEDEINEYFEEPDEEDMKEYEIYLQNIRMENELEEIVKLIEKNYNRYPTEIIPVRKARELVEQYNKTPVVSKNTPNEEVEKMTIYRKTGYTINNHHVFCISRFIHHTSLTLKKLIDFLDDFHNYNVIDESLYKNI